MARMPLPDEFARKLEQRLDDLMKGRIQFQDLPLSVAAWFHAGEASARIELNRQIENLQKQLDLAYLQAFAPKERREEYQRRLDRYFVARDAEFFDEPAAQLNIDSIGSGTAPDVEGASHDSKFEDRRRDAA